MGFKDYARRLQILKEFWLFARTQKKLWLFPVFAFLVLLSVFILFAESSILAPFIYSLF
jgi:hypothetical protein